MCMLILVKSFIDNTGSTRPPLTLLILNVPEGPRTKAALQLGSNKVGVGLETIKLLEQVEFSSKYY